MSGAVVVAAIDFGTTYSGWAFSFKHEFESDPLKISAKQWIGGSLLSSKGPTCVLIKPDGKSLEAFGYDAESKYADLAETHAHKQWYYFKRFKMELYSKGGGVKRDVKIKDATDKELSAIIVFSLAIRFLKDDVMNMSRQRLKDGGVTDADVHWVLTVPAIWDDAAKQFMREAAEKAGIAGNQLSIALEPEAASLYCRHLPVERNTGDNSVSLASFKAGKKYLVLDCGGGTVDVTVHEVTASGDLKELHKASGGGWGGTKVDDEYFKFLQKLIGAPVMRKFIDKHMEDYIDMFRDFEIKKRDIAPSKKDLITVRMPAALLDEYQEETDETLKDALPSTTYAGKITMTGDKMRVDVSVFKLFFKDALEHIVEHIGNLMRRPEVQGCAAIVMVGGFSESPMLQEEVRRKFPSTQVIVPMDAGLAVLKGAVIFGHRPNIITQRVSKYTYGVSCAQVYSSDRHPVHRKYTDKDGIDHVDNVFSVHVKAGQVLGNNEVQSTEKYSVHHSDQDGMTIQFYYTPSENPKYVDEGDCKKLGQMQVDVPGHGKDRSAEVSLQFGKTEIEASVKIIHTGVVSKAKLNFLG
ncbi:heat shock 70 kDa protein 12A-like [Dreissena polymorpha]|uniref:Uncharacterized protein n=1 Tax=Dreissena polymorpha TaxID=45954 RepID=A0A9D4H875_DREPO|nr:heat shock 70 kDa protein 12A-like [Dreissena polymorpha]KAH3830275.1 hypothetical protein DPMN_103516 [Dreissena polymorpha]